MPSQRFRYTCGTAIPPHAADQAAFFRRTNYALEQRVDALLAGEVALLRHVEGTEHDLTELLELLGPPL